VSRAERELNPGRSARDRFGYELRKWRKARGLSQDRLGALVHVSGDLVYRVELSDRRPSRDFAMRCDQALEANDTFVRLWKQIEEEEAKLRTAGPDTDKLTDNHSVGNDKSADIGTARLRSDRLVPATVDLGGVGAPLAMGAELTADNLPDEGNGDDLIVIPCQTADGRIILVSVPRRAFLAGGIGAAAAGLAAASSRAIPGASIFAAELPAVTDDPFRRFYQMRRVLRDADNLFGPERVMPLVHEQIILIRQLSNGARGVDRQRLLRVQAQFADLYAWLQQDTGNHREAQYWLDRALDWSQMSDHSEAVAFILARKSQVAGELNDATDAIDVAEVAIRRAQSGHWRAATIAATYAAHGYALQGDKPSSQREYERAYELLRKVEPDPDTSYGLFLNSAYIDVQRAHSLAVLGDNALAAEAFGEAIGSLPDGYHRDRGIYLVRKALAHAGAEEQEQAATTGLQALVIGTETNSMRIINGLARLNRTLSRWNTVPRVVEFRHALVDARLTERVRFPMKEEGE
jgi:transcriptional regulator with XRE-family HTH domain/tetratricopeptide (TPR) repeat protein